jgi:hypothetical protein
VGTFSDGLVNRRSSWTGVVVQDLVQAGTPSYGRFYRVASSTRDAQSGRWEIRWTDADYVGDVMPQGQPVYKFDGTTWDLPAYPRTAFPVAAMWCCLGSGLVFTLGVAAVVAPSERAAMMLLVWLATANVAALAWFISVEPVRGTKVAYAGAAVLALHRAHARREQQRYLDESNANPSLLVQYLATQEPGPLRDAQVQREQQAAILENQEAIARRIGLILPDHRDKGWQ